MTGNEAHVFVKSLNAELTALRHSRECGFASSIHPDTDKCLEELGQLMKDNRVLPSAIIVDIYSKMATAWWMRTRGWPLLRMVQRPHAPRRAIKECSFASYRGMSPKVETNSRCIGAAKMVTDNDAVKEGRTVGLTSERKGVEAKAAGLKEARSSVLWANSWTMSTVAVRPLLAVPREGAWAGRVLSPVSPSLQGRTRLHALRAPFGGLPRAGRAR